MPATFLTGFPGFLGSALSARLVERMPPDSTLYLLVQPQYAALARQRLLELGGDGVRTEVVEGDITLPDLGLGAQAAALAEEVDEVFHLAAVYDLSVSREVAERVNVDGTRHVLDFAARCPALRCLHYVSTCYVSGHYAGVFTEDDLDVGQTFGNHYEETKYRAEVEVQRRMREGLPVAIYRPGIVIGDSRTGETQKYDGVYFFFKWMLRWRRVVPVPIIGDPKRQTVNIVPRDFVVAALDYLSARPAPGTVYHLAAPRQPSIDAVLKALEASSDARHLRIPLPLSVVRTALKTVPALERFVGIPVEAFDYYVHPTRYACTNTQHALEGSWIQCPRFEDYAPHIVHYMREHPEIPSAPMI